MVVIKELRRNQPHTHLVLLFKCVSLSETFDRVSPVREHVLAVFDQVLEKMNSK